MKNPIQPKNNELRLREDDFIVSKTDPKGLITYANRIFMEFAGYCEHELLGKQHNIIRHPDMPRGVFHLMWEALQGGEEFFGVVKNLSRDGSFYWTFAQIMPDQDNNGRTVGYTSVRRQPKPHAVATLAPLYAEMLATEKRVGPRAAMQASRALLTDVCHHAGQPYEAFILNL